MYSVEREKSRKNIPPNFLGFDAAVKSDVSPLPETGRGALDHEFHKTESMIVTFPSKKQMPSVAVLACVNHRCTSHIVRYRSVSGYKSVRVSTKSHASVVSLAKTDQNPTPVNAPVMFQAVDGWFDVSWLPVSSGCMQVGSFYSCKKPGVNRLG